MKVDSQNDKQQKQKPKQTCKLNVKGRTESDEKRIVKNLKTE